jgi:protein-disulfide isomerase
MKLRHYAITLTGLAIIGCGQRQPQAQTATAAPKSGLDSASVDRADKARIQGAVTAKVWLVMASDFQCPFCKMFHDETYPRLVKDYVATGKIRIAYLNQPSGMHVHAVVAAEAAMCAALQDKFWPMHDGLFATQEHWEGMSDPAPVFDSLATSLQLQMSDWRSCTTSHATVPMIDGDHERVQKGGSSSTPSFFISVGGTSTLAVVGAQPYEEFKAALDAALAKAGAPVGGGKGL